MIPPMMRFPSQPTAQEQGELEGQLDRYRAALAANPQDWAAWHGLAEAYFAQANYNQAAATYRALLERLGPAGSHSGNAVLAWHNLGCVAYYCTPPQDEVAAFRQAIALAPQRAESYYELGKVYARHNRLQTAIRAFDWALRVNPELRDARWQLSHVLLKAGYLDRGWIEYGVRWGNSVPSLPNFSVPPWAGEDLFGKTILLYGEQGLGDSLQFIRYAQKLKALGARTVFLGPGPLLRLLSALPEIDAVIGAVEQAAGQADYVVPLLDLPRYLGTRTIADIPNRVPYLSVPAEAKAHLPVLFPEDQNLEKPSPNEQSAQQQAGVGSLQVGIVWATGLLDRRQNPVGHLFHSEKTLPLARLVAALEAAAVGRRQEGAAGRSPLLHLHSLQVGPYQAELAAFNQARAGSPVTDLGARVQDLADTAAMVDRLDLVVTVDTSVAHLAGGLGKPVWVLLPRLADWRWLVVGDRLGEQYRDHSPWYPTMRLFRQTIAGNWDDPLARLSQALGDWLECLGSCTK